MIPPEYVLARSVLLDALDALGVQRDAVILVGAQAVYLHTGDADLSTAPTTTDADLALVPHHLFDEPSIAVAMGRAGFVPGDQPGTWLGRGQIAVDLMVPESLCGPGGRRDARLPAHGNRVARRTLGLEAAVVDHELYEVGALGGHDGRSFTIKVAGPAALIVSKVIKIAERCDRPDRLKPKDGLDILRLLRAVDAVDLGSRLRELASIELATDVVDTAVRAIRALGTDHRGILPTLASAAEQGFENPEVIRMSMVALLEDVLRSFDAGDGFRSS